MSCDKCKRFPVPSTVFEEVDTSIERHGTLYRCKICGSYFEILEGHRSYFEISEEDANKLYRR